MRRAVIATVASAAVLVASGFASAAPQRSVRLSKSSSRASWTTETGLGTYAGVHDLYDITRCTNATRSCDRTAVQVVDAGLLSLKFRNTSPTAAVDYASAYVTVYDSDAKGSVGKRRASTMMWRDGKLTTAVRQGWYLVEVEALEGPVSARVDASLAVPRRR